MAKQQKDMSDPLVRASDARNALRRIERNKANSFKRWSDAWRARKAAVLAEIDDDTFDALLLLNVCASYDRKVRAEAMSARDAQENRGEASDEVVKATDSADWEPPF